MQTVLTQLNSVPGVIGSMTCDAEGRILSHAFPPLFDAALLEEASRVMADGAVGLEFAADDVDLLDFRFGETRLSVKPIPDAMLLVLSSRTANLQFLNLSISLAAAKLAKLKEAPAPPPLTPVPRAAAPRPPAAAVPAPSPDDAAGHKKRVAAPAKGLEELRKRLAAGKGMGEDKSVSDSVTLPIGPRGERE